MMKSNVLLAVLFAVVATSPLMSMENNNSRLNFLLNHSRCIKGYSKQNMDYAVQPNVFVGQNILDAIPLDEHDRNVLDIGFNEAVEKEITVKKFYMLKDAEFLATITPLIKANKKNNFFVKVQETSNNVELID